MPLSLYGDPCESSSCSTGMADNWAGRSAALSWHGGQTCSIRPVRWRLGHSGGSISSVRRNLGCYERRIDAWHSVWISPNQGVVKTFIARKVGDEIVLDGKSTDGYPVKWIFSEISHESFRWRSEETRDEGKTWTMKEEMRIQRR